MGQGYGELQYLNNLDKTGIYKTVSTIQNPGGMKEGKHQSE